MKRHCIHSTEFEKIRERDIRVGKHQRVKIYSQNKFRRKEKERKEYLKQFENGEASETMTESENCTAKPTVPSENALHSES